MLCNLNKVSLAFTMFNYVKNENYQQKNIPNSTSLYSTTIAEHEKICQYPALTLLQPKAHSSISLCEHVKGKV